MSLTAKKNGEFTKELIQQDGYSAVCVEIIDLGEQVNPFFDKSARKVLIVWELPIEYTTQEGETKRRKISKDYTLSLDDKAKLKQLLESWRNKKFTPEEEDGFELTKLLGVPCYLNVVHGVSKKGVEYADVGSVTKLPKEIMPLKPMSELFYFDLDAEDALEKFKGLAKYYQDRISKSITYQNLVELNIPPSKVPLSELKPIEDDDLPF